MSGGGAGIGQGFGLVSSLLGGVKAQKASNKGYNSALGSYATPPLFTKDNPWWNVLTSPNNLLGQNAQSLLSGNSLNELQPALRSADISGRNNQQAFASQLARSGLTGSGFGLGGNYAIQNQTDVNKSNILAGLPALQRQNLAALFPFFSRYLSNQEFRSGGQANLFKERGNMNAAAEANRWGTVAGAAGGGGKGGGGKGGANPNYLSLGSSMPTAGSSFWS